MTDPIQIKHYKEDITSFNQLYKEFQRRFVGSPDNHWGYA